MKKGIFILNSDFKNIHFKQNLLETLYKTYKNIKVFYPIFEENVQNCNTALTKNEAIDFLLHNQKDELSKLLIDKFNSIDADFIIVVGGILNEMDTELARHFNCPFFFSEQNSYKKAICNFAVVENLDKIKNPKCLSALNFENTLYQKAKSNIKTIVLPEGDDERILLAGDELLRNNAVKIILLGSKEEIKNRCKKLNINLEKAQIINPCNNNYLDNFAKELYELRKNKGMDLKTANELIRDRTYFATMLIHKNIADAMVGGANTTTANTIRPALQIIKTKPGVTSVSGSFFICVDDKILVFADCAIIPNPTTDELAQIAISTAKMAKMFLSEPKIAMLSYSTKDSGSGPSVDFVVEATKKIKQLDPNLLVEGPIQFDAAINRAVAAKKLPNSKVAGHANVFIFPDLNCANICYKAVQQSAKAVAIGPVLQGLNKPINDLSRGCLVKDIVNTVLISAIQAQGE